MLVQWRRGSVWILLDTAAREEIKTNSLLSSQHAEHQYFSCAVAHIPVSLLTWHIDAGGRICKAPLHTFALLCLFHMLFMCWHSIFISRRNIVQYCNKTRLNIIHICNIDLIKNVFVVFSGIGTGNLRWRTLSYKKTWEHSSCQVLSR